MAALLVLGEETWVLTASTQECFDSGSEDGAEGGASCPLEASPTQRPGQWPSCLRLDRLEGLPEV